MVGEERQRFADAGIKQIGDRPAVPGDGEHLGLETAALADRARHEHIGQKLHLDAFVAEPLTVVAPAVAAIERKTGRAEAGRLRGGRRGVEFADELPRLGIERGIGTRGAADRRLVDEDVFAQFKVGTDRLNRGGILGQLVALREQALVDDVVEQRGFAGAGDAAQADQPLQRQTEVQAGDVVLGGAAEFQPGGRVEFLISYC